MQNQLPPNRLKELREAHGLKLYELAAKLSTHPSTIWRWETGEQVNVPDSAKLALAELYGVTPAYLMGWEAAQSSRRKQSAAA